MKAPERLETTRLVLTRPRADDAAAVFRYASDPEVTRFVGWPRHRSIADTRAFLALSDQDWTLWPAGPYLITSRADGRVMGGTGLGFEAPDAATTGYILAREAWGQGYATEALQAMVGLALELRVARLSAFCHPQHRASWHVLEKCRFIRHAVLPAHAEFPNLAPGTPADVLCYVLETSRLLLSG